MRLYIGLVHYPVYNKNHERIASAITTLDLHDMARLTRTYDIGKLFVITPLEDQQALVERVQRHWTEGYGARYNQDRKEAIERICVVASLDQAIDSIVEMEGETPLLIATDAAEQEDRPISYDRARSIIQEERVVALIFGTAWGLDREVIEQADHVLAPIMGRTKYNHLSVRTAAAIIIDRLVSTDLGR